MAAVGAFFKARGGASAGQLEGDEQPPLNHPAPPPLGKGGAAATNASPLPFGRNNLAWGGGTAWPSIASRMNQHYDSHQPLKPVSVSAARPQSWPWDRQRRSGWPLHGEGCQTPPACPRPVRCQAVSCPRAC